MLFQLKEKIWTFKDTYFINDEHGQPAYKVVGKVFSWGDNLSFRNHNDEEILQIKQVMWTFMPKYTLLREGQELAEVVKKFSWFKQKFILDVPGPNDYTISGSFWNREFEFIRQDKVVARVSKQFWSWADTYGIDIDEEEDVDLILATCIIIDLVLFDKKNDNKSGGGVLNSLFD